MCAGGRPPTQIVTCWDPRVICFALFISSAVHIPRPGLLLVPKTVLKGTGLRGLPYQEYIDVWGPRRAPAPGDVLLAQEARSE